MLCCHVPKFVPSFLCHSLFLSPFLASVFLLIRLCQRVWNNYLLSGCKHSAVHGRGVEFPSPLIWAGLGDLPPLACGGSDVGLWRLDPRKAYSCPLGLLGCWLLGCSLLGLSLCVVRVPSHTGSLCTDAPVTSPSECPADTSINCHPGEWTILDVQSS